MNDKEITITIYEGRPQRITKLPKGYRLKIINYDIGEELDEDGNLCSTRIYEEEGDLI